MRRVTRVAVVFVGLALASGCGGGSATGPSSDRAASGEPLYLQLAGLDGGEVDLQSYRGRVVVLHLFATWADGALLDVDQLSALHRRDDRCFAVIGVALDAEGDRLVGAWRRALKVPYLLAVASDALANGETPLGRIDEVPTTIVLDPEGRETARLAHALAPGELDRVVAPPRRRCQFVSQPGGAP